MILGLVSALALAAPVRGVATSVEDPEHAGLAHWFQALRAASEGQGVARAIHYGDSTIAMDGFARTVRARLVARFGDAGPGFVTASFDPVWHQRSEIIAHKRGDWTSRNILRGGADGRYGLGGIVGIARPGASVRLSVQGAEDSRVPQHHLELWYQAGTDGYGELWAQADGVEIARESAQATETEDRRLVRELPEGVGELSFGATGGTVPIYGVVLETGAPGATWEALGVLGVSSRSFSVYAGEALAPQVALRDPDLVVVMLGGNEAGYPVLLGKGGAGYAPIFEGGLSTILAGAGDASCLAIAPLDQGFLDEEGIPHGRPGMQHLVDQQRAVASAHGCAFWSARDAMGGEGAALRWGRTAGLGAGDFVHVTPKALTILGDLLADALLADYEDWLAHGAITAAAPAP